MTVETKASITLAAEDHASPVIRNVLSEVNKLSKAISNLGKIKTPALQISAPSSAVNRATSAATIQADGAAMVALRRRFAFEGRLARQEARERADDAKLGEQQRRTFEAAAMRDLRQRLAFTARMSKQRLADERTVAREQQRAADQTDRDAASALQRRIAGDRWRIALRTRMERQEASAVERTRREAMGHGRDAWRHGRDAVRDTTRPLGVAALAGSAAATAATRRILTAESPIDGAEINSRIYGGLDQNAARRLRDQWASPLAEALGTGTDKLLTAWVDATKLGIPAAGAESFAELATKTSEAWSVPFEAVTDVLGTVNTILTSKGDAFDAGKLRSVANTLQHLAAKQSTTPEKLMSFLQRGAGAAQVLGMSQEAGLAFGSASTSLGNQAGQSGRMFDYLASRVIELPRLTKQTGDQGKQARDLVAALGYGSADTMDRQRRADPDAFLADFMERFNRIKSQKKQDSAIRFFTGREWLGEFGRMVKGIDTYKEAVKLAKEAKGLDAIGAVWELHRTKLGFVFKQFRAGWLNILGEFGKVLSPLARQAGDFFLDWSAKLRTGGIESRFKAALEGLVDGLGFKSFTALLQGMFGKPGEGDAGAVEAWRTTFREFGAGIRDVVGSIKGLVGAVTGGSPEVLARWTGRILTLTGALVVLSPVLTVLGGLATGILAIGSAAATAYAAFKVAGLAGSGTGVAGLLSAATLTTAGGVIAAAFLAKIAEAYNILRPPSFDKGLGRGVLEFLDPRLPGLADRLFGGKPAETDAPARVEKQSTTGDWRGLIQPASHRTNDELVDGMERLDRSFQAMGARIHLATLGNPAASALATFGGGSPSGLGSGGGGGSGGGDPAQRFGRNFFTPGQSVPGWFGGGNGATGPMLKGEAAANAKKAYDFFRAKGLSHEATSGILGNVKHESNFNPNARGDGGNAHGLFQHHADRRAAILRGSGIDMSRASIDKQLEGVWWEMNHGDAGAQRALKALQTPGITAGQAGHAFGKHFERPAERHLRWRGRAGEEMAAQMAGGGTGAGSGAPGTGPQVAGGFHPLDGKGRFTSDFGMRKHPLNGMFKMHKGIDLAASAGTAVKAMKDGIVSVGRQGDVTIKHPDGTSTVYRHISPKVGNGENVTGGQAIGAIAPTDGRSTGPHLHLEHLDANGRPQDPKALLSKVPVGIAGQGNTPESLAAKVPMPPARSGGVGGPPGLDQGGTGFQKQGGGNGGGVVIHQVIHGAGENPNVLAGKIQKHITEAWNYRASDMEPDLA